MNNEVDVTVGENIRKIRTRKSLTVADLATKSGLDEYRVLLIESGMARATADELYGIKTALGTDVKALYEH